METKTGKSIKKHNSVGGIKWKYGKLKSMDLKIAKIASFRQKIVLTKRGAAQAKQDYAIFSNHAKDLQN